MGASESAPIENLKPTLSSLQHLLKFPTRIDDFLFTESHSIAQLLAKQDFLALKDITVMSKNELRATISNAWFGSTQATMAIDKGMIKRAEFFFATFPVEMFVERNFLKACGTSKMQNIKLELVHDQGSYALHLTGSLTAQLFLKLGDNDAFFTTHPTFAMEYKNPKHHMWLFEGILTFRIGATAMKQKAELAIRFDGTNVLRMNSWVMQENVYKLFRSFNVDPHAVFWIQTILSKVKDDGAQITTCSFFSNDCSKFRLTIMHLILPKSTILRLNYLRLHHLELCIGPVNCITGYSMSNLGKVQFSVAGDAVTIHEPTAITSIVASDWKPFCLEMAILSLPSLLSNAKWTIASLNSPFNLTDKKLEVAKQEVKFTTENYRIPFVRFRPKVLLSGFLNVGPLKVSRSITCNIYLTETLNIPFSSTDSCRLYSSKLLFEGTVSEFLRFHRVTILDTAPKVFLDIVKECNSFEFQGILDLYVHMLKYEIFIGTEWKLDFFISPTHLKCLMLLKRLENTELRTYGLISDIPVKVSPLPLKDDKFKRDLLACALFSDVSFIS